MGRWVKLICGASYQDMPAIRRLTMIYALAGVDCIDVAADYAVVAAARQGLEDALQLATYWGDRDGFVSGERNSLMSGLPWLMVSLNDSEDPHFRKAYFDAAHCPPECDRPCQSICPTAAIEFPSAQTGGVARDLCYGCGRCIAVCPFSNIEAQPYLARPEVFSADQLTQIDAVEIHTQTGHQEQFAQLWQRLQSWRPSLKLISISCPDHHQVVPYLWDLYSLMAPLDLPLIWQTDGRPMSGDLGKGTTHAAIRLAQKILDAGPPGFVQPAGGTNGYTIGKLIDLGLVNTAISGSLLDDSSLSNDFKPPAGVNRPDISLRRSTISGIAYGSYGRSQILPLLDAIDHDLQAWLGNTFLDQSTQGKWEKNSSNCSFRSSNDALSAPAASGQRLEEGALGQGLALARDLVGQLKFDRHFLSPRYG